MRCIKILRGYVFRLYPTEEQEALINKTFAATRFIYNYFLTEQLQLINENKKQKTAKEQLFAMDNLINKYPWLREVDKCALRVSIFNLADANKRKNQRRNKQELPKFKRKGINERYSINNFHRVYGGKAYDTIKIDIKNQNIILPKLNKVKISGYKNKQSISGEIKRAVIKKDAGKYYVSINVAEDITPVVTPASSIIGIDLGLKDFITTSQGQKYKNESFLNKKRLKGLLKGLSRCQKNSKNSQKIKLKIQKLYQKERNKRKYMVDKITNEILADNDIIVVENLDIDSMKSNKEVSASFNETPMYEVVRVLKYKCEWQGKQLMQIGRYYPSSQICSVCGYQNPLLKDMHIRNWTCPACHNEHDRDINAAINIMFEGVKKYIKQLK